MDPPLPRQTRRLGAEGLCLRGVLGDYVLRTNGEVHSLAVSTDGRMIVSATLGGNLNLWDASTGEELASLRGSGGFYSVALSPDGKLVLAGGSHSLVSCWDVASRKLVRAFPVKKPLVKCIAVSADNQWVLYGDDRKPRVFDLATGTELVALKGHQAQVDHVAFSPDGAFALTAAGDQKIKLHALAKRKVLATFTGYSAGLGFSPDGQRAFSTGFDHVKIWAVPSGEEIASLDDVSRGAGASALSPDGRRLAIAYADRIDVLELDTRKVIGSIAHPGARTVAFCSNGEALVSGDGGTSLGHGTALRISEIATGRLRLPTSEGHLGAVTAVASRARVTPAPGQPLEASPEMAISVAIDATLRVWDLDAMRLVARHEPLTGVGRAVAVSRDGTTAVTTSSWRHMDSPLQLWSLTEGTARELSSEAKRGGGVDVALSPDERTVAHACYVGVGVELYALPGGERLRALDGHKAQIEATCFVAGGAQLLSAAADKKLILWSVTDGEQLHVFEGHDGFVSAVTGVPGTDLAVSGGTDGALLVWSLTERRALAPLRKSGGEVFALAASPDGRVASLVAMVDWRSTSVELWNVERRELEASFNLSTAGDRGRSITFTADGKKLLVGTNRGVVLVFERSAMGA